MADDTTHVTEKVYCYDHPSAYSNGNEAALCAAMMNSQKQNDPAMMAMMANQSNSWNSNPFAYLIWLMAMRWMNWDNNGNNTAENFNSRQIAALQDTINNNNSQQTILDSLTAKQGVILDAMNNNQSAIRELAQTFNTDINAVQAGIYGVQNAISQVGGQIGMTSQQVINSVLLGNKDLTQALQTCCCENKMMTQQMGYEGQIRDLQNTAAIQSGIENTRQAVVNGFAQIGYAQAQQTNDLLTNANANTQRIADLLQNHWQAETSLALSDAKAELSNLKQTNTILSALNNNGCSCNS